MMDFVTLDNLQRLKLLSLVVLDNIKLEHPV